MPCHHDSAIVPGRRYRQISDTPQASQAAHSPPGQACHRPRAGQGAYRSAGELRKRVGRPGRPPAACDTAVRQAHPGCGRSSTCLQSASTPSPGWRPAEDGINGCPAPRPAAESLVVIHVDPPGGLWRPHLAVRPQCFGHVIGLHLHQIAADQHTQGRPVCGSRTSVPRARSRALHTA
jgi:hypothetical protein